MLDLYLRLRAHKNHLQFQQQHQEQQLQLAHQQQLHQHRQPLGYHYQQQHHAEQRIVSQQQQHEPGPMNLSTSVHQNVDRTYAELQTVRPGVAVDATEVLRRHNNDDDETDEMSPVPETSQTAPATKQTIKEEVILPTTPSFQDSVVLQSVRPMPASVAAVPAHVPASGIVGRGKFFISAEYDKSVIGPIYVETELELKSVSAIIQEKVGELKAKMETGSKLSFVPSTEGKAFQE